MWSRVVAHEQSLLKADARGKPDPPSLYPIYLDRGASD